MTLQEQVNFYTDKFGMKLGFVAYKTDIIQSNLSAWLHYKIDLSPYNIRKIKEFIELCESVDEFLERKRID